MLVFTDKSPFRTVRPQKKFMTFPGLFQNFSKTPGLSRTLFKFQDFPGPSRTGGNHVNTSIFMYNIKTGTGPSTFDTIFGILSYSYPGSFSSVDYSKPRNRLRKNRFRICIRGLCGKRFATNTKKELKSSLKEEFKSTLFKAKVKTKLLDFESESFSFKINVNLFCFLFFYFE